MPPLPADCPRPDEFGPSTYTGVLDTHPDAVAIDAGGYSVADAAANAILQIDKNGRISTTAVLPPQKETNDVPGGQVSKIVNGAPVAIASITNPAGLEFAKGKLYVTYDVFGNGKVGTINL